jgi:membrane protease subunit (stomatin/prohibitin family)
LVKKLLIFIPLDIVYMINMYVNDTFNVIYSSTLHYYEDELIINLKSDDMILNYEKITFNFEIRVYNTFCKLDSGEFVIKRPENENYVLITQYNESTIKYNKLLKSESYNFVDENITVFDESNTYGNYSFHIDDYILYFNHFMKNIYKKYSVTKIDL